MTIGASCPWKFVHRTDPGMFLVWRAVRVSIRSPGTGESKARLRSAFRTPSVATSCGNPYPPTPKAIFILAASPTRVRQWPGCSGFPCPRPARRLRGAPPDTRFTCDGGPALASSRAFAADALTFSQRVGSRAHPSRLLASGRFYFLWQISNTASPPNLGAKAPSREAVSAFVSCKCRQSRIVLLWDNMPLACPFGSAGNDAVRSRRTRSQAAGAGAGGS